MSKKLISSRTKQKNWRRAFGQKPGLRSLRPPAPARRWTRRRPNTCAARRKREKSQKPSVIEIEPSSFLLLTKIDLYDSGDERSAADAAMTRARFHRQHHDGGWSNARALEAQLVALGSERDRPIGWFFFHVADEFSGRLKKNRLRFETRRRKILFYFHGKKLNCQKYRRRFFILKMVILF